MMHLCEDPSSASCVQRDHGLFIVDLDELTSYRLEIVNKFASCMDPDCNILIFRGDFGPSEVCYREFSQSVM